MKEGKEGVLASFESSEHFHDDWKSKATEMLARGEFRRRKLTKRVSLPAALCNIKARAVAAWEES